MSRTDEDERRIAKLPAWAQMMIERMERDIADAQATIQNFHGDKETRVEVDPYAASMRTGAKSSFIPERQIIRFHVAGGRVDVRFRGDELAITGDASDHRSLFAVLPEASNAVCIGFAPRPPKG